MIEAREYQRRALVAGKTAFDAGHRAVLFVGPTGCGKTTIFSLMAKARAGRGQRVAVFAHRIELIDQAAARLRTFGLRVGSNGADVAAPVQVTSVQTCLARRSMPEADLVILDEAHHYVASQWNDVPKAYAQAKSQIVGFTATPERPDGVGLGDVFDEIVVVAQIAELTSLGFLVECEILDPESSVSTKSLAMDPWEAYTQHAPGRSAVVFAPHVKAAHSFADDFASKGISVGVVHATQGECDRKCAEKRADTLSRFADGSISVVVNVNVLTEGWDCPRAKVCILARRYGSPSQYLQSVGRVLRPDGSGERALLIDLAGNVALHGPPEEERLFALSGTAVSRWGDMRDGVRICRSCKAEIPPDVPGCVKCYRELPTMIIPKAEGIALRRFIREERKREALAARAEAPADPATKALGTLYIKGLRRGHKRGAAEYIYSLHRKRPPTTEMRVLAWQWAQSVVGQEKHDAWEAPEA